MLLFACVQGYDVAFDHRQIKASDADMTLFWNGPRGEVENIRFVAMQNSIRKIARDLQEVETVGSA